MTSTTIDERLERIRALDQEIAGIPEQMKVLRDGEGAKRSERESLTTALREEMGAVLRLRKPRGKAVTPAGAPARVAGSATRPPTATPTA